MKTILLPLTPDGRLIDEINFRGNIVCHAWFPHIKTNAGKTDTIGCLILSEIIYWYRGADVIENGKVIGRKRKFDADLLQKNYGDFVEQFGFTKKQVKDAFDRLEKAGLIERVWRMFKVRGMTLANVLFIRVFPEKIRAVSFFPEAQPVVEENAAPGVCPQKCGEVPSALLIDHPKFAPTGDGIPGDKYIEYPRDYPRDISLTVSTTASSMKPGKPASTGFSNPSPETAWPSSLAREETATPSGSNQAADPVNPLTSTIGPAAEGNFSEINRLLVQAFGGTVFSRHGEAKLKEYVQAGRITRAWAKSFAFVKSAFDQDRKGFGSKKKFIPVHPGYFFNQFDLMEKAMVDTLSDWRYDLDEKLQGFDEEEYVQGQHVITAYDEYFRQNKCLEPGYEAWVTAYPGRHDLVFDVLNDPKTFPDYYDMPVVPLAWMRLSYAFKAKVT